MKDLYFGRSGKGREKGEGGRERKTIKKKRILVREKKDRLGKGRVWEKKGVGCVETKGRLLKNIGTRKNTEKGRGGVLGKWR